MRYHIGIYEVMCGWRNCVYTKMFKMVSKILRNGAKLRVYKMIAKTALDQLLKLFIVVSEM